jgi:hypothetical protein
MYTPSGVVLLTALVSCTVAQIKSRQPNKEQNRLDALRSSPAPAVDYRLEVGTEPGGVRVSVNLQFLPSVYTGKTFAVDGSVSGVLSRSPRDPMREVRARAAMSDSNSDWSMTV